MVPNNWYQSRCDSIYLDRVRNPRWQELQFFSLRSSRDSVSPPEVERVGDQSWCVASKGSIGSLAPKKKQTKFQLEMSKSVEDLSTQFELMSKQFAGFQTMMREALDKISGLEEWRSSADEAFDEMLQKADSVVSRVD